MKKYVADALSLFRALAVIPVGIFAYEGWWSAAFIALILGWATDMFDGAAARKWGSIRNRKPSFDADGIADSALAFGSTAIVATYLTTHYSFGWTTFVAWGVTLVVGTAMALMMDAKRTMLRRWLVAINMVVFHGGVQIIGTIGWFAYMAYGLPTAAALTLVIVMFSTEAFGPKISLWLRGEFSPPTSTEGK